MASPPSLKRLDESKFDDMPDSFHSEFLPAFNGFTSDTTNGLTELLARPVEYRELVFTTPSSSVSENAAPFPLYLKPQTAKNWSICTVVNPTLRDGASPGAAAQALYEKTADGQLKVRFVTGITTSTTYKMLLRIE